MRPGCGAFYSNQWFQYRWPPEWLSLGIMAKELVPIIISCAVWGRSFAKKRIEVKCDNQSLVIAINKGTARDSLVMQLLRCLWFFIAIFDIDLIATHISGIHNKTADMLSRNQLREFFAATPEASQFPTLLPLSLLNLNAPQQLDWTSPSFLQQFQETILTST